MRPGTGHSFTMADAILTDGEPQRALRVGGAVRASPLEPGPGYAGLCSSPASA